MICREKREVRAIRIPDGVRSLKLKSSCGCDACDLTAESGEYLVWADDDSDPCVYDEENFRKDFDVVSANSEARSITIPNIPTPNSPPPYIPAGMRQCASCGAHMPYGQIHVCYGSNPLSGQVVHTQMFEVK